MHRTDPGFTLIELLVTVAMAAIVLTAGVPSFQTTIKNNRLTAAANALVGALNLARSEAIKRGVRVTACKSADGSSCTTSGNWEQGWIVFTDENNNGNYDSASETLLRVQGRLPPQLTLRTGSNFSDWVSYLPSGISRGNSGLPNDTFRLCDGGGVNTARKITVSSTGRVSVTKGVASCP